MTTENGNAQSTEDNPDPGKPNPWTWIDPETLAHIRALVASWPEPGMTQLRAVASLRQVPRTER